MCVRKIESIFEEEVQQACNSATTGEIVFGERDGQTTPGFTFSKPESPATSDGDATPRTAEDIALDATAVGDPN